MVFPPFLDQGSKVCLVSPAGAIDEDLVKGAKNTLISWGLRVETGKHVSQKSGRFSGTAKQRLDDLQGALDDPDCQAVFCTRGGYGAIHLIDRIDLGAFKRHPKWVVGFSDITMLHALLQKEGYASIHGGMAKMLALQPNSTPAVCLKRVLSGDFPIYEIPYHPLNRIGEKRGTLIGGNLSILYSLRGTPYDYIPAGCVLFIEDIGEKPYIVDRMMHNLKLGGVLKNLSGLVVGQFTDYEEDSSFGKTIYEIIADAVSEYSYPTCFNFPTGHIDRNLPLVTGSPVVLRTTQTGTLLISSINEPTE